MSKNIGIAWLLVLCLVPAAPLAAAEPTAMAQAIAAIKLKPGWDRIELKTAEPQSYLLNLWYKPAGKTPRPQLAAVEADTKGIARAVLAQLVKEGRSPVKERIAVSVWAFQPGVKGETGTPLNIAFGATEYDYNSDRLTFRDWQALHGR